jgi:hypothetical protein
LFSEIKLEDEYSGGIIPIISQAVVKFEYNRK